MSSRYKDALGLIVMENFKDFGNKIDKKIREERKLNTSFIIPSKLEKFDDGTKKVVVDEDLIKDRDIYILSDVYNYSMTYPIRGFENHYDPDSHYQDIKRCISAIAGEADRINVVAPLLYASRQHRRKLQESLDCSLALQELQNLGVKRIITFDVHDPNIENALYPTCSLDNFYPTHPILEEIIKNEDFDPKDLIVIGPDMGAADRAKYSANMFGADLGLFHKRRDYSIVVNGQSPVVEHVYLGKDLKDKTVIISDDIISSGGSMIDVAKDAKENGAKRVYMLSSFALMTKGTKVFNDAYKDGLFDKLYSTNLTYVDEETVKMPWYKEVDLSDRCAGIINAFSSGTSLKEYKNGKDKILQLIKQKQSM